MYSVQVVEDLEGVEVIADDFLIAGFGSIDQEVHNSHKTKWAHFSQEILPLEAIVDLCQSETAPVKCEIHGSPIGSQGLRPNPKKIQAILQMLEPEVITMVKLMTYLAKFTPHLSDMR